MKRQDNGTPDPIREALRALPRERASEEFTVRLLERAAAPRAPRLRRPRRRRLAAAALIVLAATTGALLLERQQERRELDRRLALELRHEELRRELAALRREVTDPPTLYLGATSEYDVVLDLGPWMERGPVRPASFEVPNH